MRVKHTAVRSRAVVSESCAPNLVLDDNFAMLVRRFPSKGTLGMLALLTYSQQCYQSRDNTSSQTLLICKF